MKHLKKFDTHSEYITYIQSSDKILPNVSICGDDVSVHYNAIITFLDKPLFSGITEGQRISQATDLTITSPDNADIYYTLDGTIPTKSSTKYTAPISFTEVGSYTVKAICASGKIVSDVATINFNYSNVLISTITIDNTESASVPATKITGDTVCTAANTRKAGVDSTNNAIAWIRDNSHRYIGKYVNNEFKIAKLSDTDSTKYADDNTSAPITTLGNDVFMKLPEFWWKCEETTNGTDKWNISFSDKEQTGWNHWDGKTFIGVYKTYESGNIPYSCSGKTFTIDVSQQDFKSHAATKGTTYHLVTYEAHQIMCLLFWAYYGNTNSQAICGSAYNSSYTAGSSNSMGMSDSLASGSSCVNFWGLEQWWGGKYEWMDNLKTTNSSGAVGLYAPGTSTLIRTIQAGVTEGNEIKLMLLGANGDVIQKSITSNGSYDTYYADYGGVRSGSGFIATRSYSDSYAAGGVSCLFVNYSPSDSGSYYGSRLTCIPTSYTEITKF